VNILKRRNKKELSGSMSSLTFCYKCGVQLFWSGTLQEEIKFKNILFPPLCPKCYTKSPYRITLSFPSPDFNPERTRKIVERKFRKEGLVPTFSLWSKFKIFLGVERV